MAFGQGFLIKKGAFSRVKIKWQLKKIEGVVWPDPPGKLTISCVVGQRESDFHGNKPSTCLPSCQAEYYFSLRLPRPRLSQTPLGLRLPRRHEKVKETGLETPGGVTSGFHPWPARKEAEYCPCLGLMFSHSPESKAGKSYLNG